MKQGILMEGNLKADSKIYRYMSLGQFMTLIEYDKTYLTRINEWEDTWEIPGSKLPVRNLEGRLEIPRHSAADNLFGQCWSLNGCSDALWRIYSPERQGLLIQSTIEKVSKIKDILRGMIAPVIYYDNLDEALRTIEKKENYRVFSEGFLKRKAFGHEEEVRLITVNNTECLGRKLKDSSHIEFDIDKHELIEGIQVDPRASEWYVNMIKQYCKRAGLRPVPEKSDLYSENVFEKSRLIRKYGSEKE